MIRKNALRSFIFSAPWILYCGYLWITAPTLRNGNTLFSVLLGTLFLWLTGFLLLVILPRHTVKPFTLACLTAIFVAIDQISKRLMMSLAPPEGLPLLGPLELRVVPNRHNSVAFSLLDIQVPAVWMAVFKLVLITAFTVILLRYCRSYGYNMSVPPFQLGLCLVGASALCSVLDTAILGYVPDYIVLRDLVAFDPKDLYMMYGVGLLLPVIFRWESAREREKHQTEHTEDS